MTDWQLIVDWRALGAAHRELLIGELWCHEIYGIEERGDVAVVGFATEVAARAAAAAIAASSGVSVTIVELVEDTYLDEWRSFARPWRVSGLFVRPSWVDAEAPPGTIEIVIDPQRSFGSGAHASTRLTLELMQSLDLSGCTVLDVGCGSGVLSVAAAVLGAAHVDAIDIEPEAVAATAANALCNGVDDRIHARVATVGSVGEQFDIVLANVLPSVHREIADELRGRNWRFAIVAGMLDAQVADVESAYGATRIASRSEGEWTALCLQIDRTDGAP